MKKIITIIGARPQFVKAAVVSRAIKANSSVEETIIHTGQHYDANMSDVFFEQMQIPKPNYFLGINGLRHGAMTGQMLEKIEEVLLKEKPDWVLVYGDTNSTLAGALAASKLHIRIAHVEAGLRSFNTKMPEEINRILTDRISQVLFCPTQTAVNNLATEGFEQFNCSIINVGDVMYDAALFYEKQIDASKNKYADTNYALCTIHRQENTDNKENLTSIFNALEEIGKEKKIIIPLHPRTRKFIEKYDISINPNYIEAIEPVGYLDMIDFIKNSDFVITDSGGLQKEAYFFKKYCLTLRTETEWTELGNVGANFICGSSRNTILENFSKIAKQKHWNNKQLYGNGNAGERIVSWLLQN